MTNMQTQNLLVAALLYLIEYQATQCVTAKKRALMAFEALANAQDCSDEIDALCSRASTLLHT